MGSTVKLGVLVSGRGSNLQSIIDAIESGRLDGSVEVVLSDKADAYALERAAGHRIEGVHIDPGAHGDRQAYDEALIKELRRRDVDLVILAGFMRILSPSFIEAFPNRIMNIHPSLLPSFPGLHVQQKALDHGARFSGCTVHFVDTGVDTGPIIIQAVVPVFDDDTDDTLSARILRQEHRIYPHAIQLFADGRLTVSGRRVLVSGSAEGKASSDYLVNPSLA